MAAQPAAILTVQQLSLVTSQKTLFQGLTFQLGSQEILAVMGPSGIGKSMLAKAIAGFLPRHIQASGQIQLAGKDVCQCSILRRLPAQRPAVIFQDALTALNPLARIEQQLSLALSGDRLRFNDNDKAQVQLLLKQLGFAEPDRVLAQFPSQLSGGQRQRICIAMAMLGQSQLLIADEPTSALDPITEMEILRLLQQSIKQKEMAGLLITHDLHAALSCDKLLVIDDGQMVAYGAPRHAIEQSPHPFCQQLSTLLP